MGLDQYLTYRNPDYFNPGSNTTDIAYWRKDWDLQEFISSRNCEEIEVTEDLCDDILDHLDVIYSPDNSYKEETREAFTKAKKLIQSGEEVIYAADW